MNARQRSSEMPDLRVLRVADLLLHEQHDAQRSDPLAQRIASDGVLKNPPIVAPVDGGPPFVVLDGANRVTAASALGLVHIAAQVVDYDDPALALDTWHHLVCGFPRDRFDARVEELVGARLEPTDVMHARALVARREALAFVVHPDGRAYAVGAAGDLHERTARLNALVDIYRSHGRICRVRTDHIDDLLSWHDDVTALVVFPRYEPAEIVDLARVGARLPAGITRHLIPHRALRVNFPVSLLRDDRSAQSKNDWLKDWVKAKLQAKEVRTYQESTVLFDE